MLMTATSTRSSALQHRWLVLGLLGTGQLMGNSYCGGMTVTPSLTFGRLLGQKFMHVDA